MTIAGIPSDQLSTIAARWARIGIWLSVDPATEPVDVEALIVLTARLARADERLFVDAASWLAMYHGLVNGRRLLALMSRLARTDRTASAVAGALLTVARQGARANGSRASELDGAIEASSPLARPLPQYHRTPTDQRELGPEEPRKNDRT